MNNHILFRIKNYKEVKIMLLLCSVFVLPNSYAQAASPTYFDGATIGNAYTVIGSGNGVNYPNAVSVILTSKWNSSSGDMLIFKLQNSKGEDLTDEKCVYYRTSGASVTLSYKPGISCSSWNLLVRAYSSSSITLYGYYC